MLCYLSVTICTAFQRQVFSATSSLSQIVYSSPKKKKSPGGGHPLPQQKGSFSHLLKETSSSNSRNPFSSAPCFFSFSLHCTGSLLWQCSGALPQMTLQNTLPQLAIEAERGWRKQNSNFKDWIVPSSLHMCSSH